MNAQANGLLVDFPLQHAPGGSYHGNLFQTHLLASNRIRFPAVRESPPGPCQGLLSQGILAQVLRAIEIGNEDCHSHRLVRSVRTMPPPMPRLWKLSPVRFAPMMRSWPRPRSSGHMATLISGWRMLRVNQRHAACIRSGRPSLATGTRKPGDAGPGKLLDYVNVHYYHNNADPDTVIAPTRGSIYPYGQDSFAAVFGEMLQDAQAFKVVNHSKEPMPIWVTETGWALTDCNQTAAPVTASNQAVYEQKMLDEARQSNAHATGGRGAVTHLFLFSADKYSANCGDNGMDISDHGIAQPAGVMLPAYVQSHPTWP